MIFVYAVCIGVGLVIGLVRAARKPRKPRVRLTPAEKRRDFRIALMLFFMFRRRR